VWNEQQKTLVHFYGDWALGDSMYYCKKCNKIYDYETSPFDLKCALNPELAVKETWENNDWDAPIGFCECGGEIEVGTPYEFISLDYGEHERLSWTLGCDEHQLPKMMKKHPGAEFRKAKSGGYQMVIKNRTEKLRRYKEAGAEEYTLRPSEI